MIRIWLVIFILGAVGSPGARAEEQTKPDEIQRLEHALAQLRAQEAVFASAPEAMVEAERAVLEATMGRLSADERSYRVHLAHRRIQLAEAAGRTRLAEREIEAIEQRRNALLLRASRLEAEQARLEAERALLLSATTLEQMRRAQAEALGAEERSELAARQAAQSREEAEQARRLAEAQRAEVELARREAELASQTADSLRRRLEYMEYRETDRGVVVTLGDVLFEVGQAELLPGSYDNLQDVLELLRAEPDRHIRIEGHTDSTGSNQLNLRLSQQRAEAVRTALVELGVPADRVHAVGMGQDFPIATNETDEGRARNRRVDVIVLNE